MYRHNSEEGTLIFNGKTSEVTADCVLSEINPVYDEDKQTFVLDGDELDTVKTILQTRRQPKSRTSATATASTTILDGFDDTGLIRSVNTFDRQLFGWD